MFCNFPSSESSLLKYKKDMILQSSISWNIRIFFRMDFLIFFELGLKSSPSSPIIHYYCVLPIAQLLNFDMIQHRATNIAWDPKKTIKHNKELQLLLKIHHRNYIFFNLKRLVGFFTTISENFLKILQSCCCRFSCVFTQW